MTSCCSLVTSNPVTWIPPSSSTPTSSLTNQIESVVVFCPEPAADEHPEVVEFLDLGISEFPAASPVPAPARCLLPLLHSPNATLCNEPGDWLSSGLDSIYTESPRASVADLKDAEC